MSKYQQYIEKTEKWRGAKTDRHIVDRFMSRYDLIYDTDDYIPEPDGIREFAKAASKGDYDLIYCDEDVVRDHQRMKPYFKPDYSPESEKSLDYISGMVALKKGRRSESYYTYPRDKVCHISRVLYHRSRERSVPDVPPEDSFVDKSPGRISVIILSKDHPDMLERCVRSILSSLVSDDVEIILIDNGSGNGARRRYEEIAMAYRLRYHYRPGDFNYSELNNYGASQASGDIYIFMNDDVEVPFNEKGILERMATKATEDNVGAVGIKLLYPDGRIQHCGIALLYSGPSHKLQGYKNERYYYGYSDHDINTIAVTGACLCVRRDRFDKTGGFDISLPVAYNDVDLCMNIYKMGYYNVCLNSHSLIHYEGATRTDDRTSRLAYDRLKREREQLISRHGDLIDGGDPFMNKNLSPYSLDFDINLPSEWELAGISEVRSSVGRMKRGTHIHAALDGIEYRLSDAYGNEDFYEVTGWIFREGILDLKPVVVIEAGGSRYAAEAFRMRRVDVGEVFPKFKKSADSGFIARIPAKKMERYEVKGEIKVYPALMTGNRRIYKGDDECMRKTEI